MRKILVAVAIGLTLGLIIITFNVAVAKADDCMSASDTHSWGIWPYEQFVSDHTYFCWGWKNGSKQITYRTDNVTGSGNVGGGLCSLNPPTQSWIIGKNNFYREWTVEGDFTCPTDIPYVNIYPHDKFDIWINADGTYCGPDTEIGKECTG